MREELGIDAGPVITKLAGDRKELRVAASRDERGGDRLHAMIGNEFLDGARARTRGCAPRRVVNGTYFAARRRRSRRR